jgi:hypothetical protein
MSQGRRVARPGVAAGSESRPEPESAAQIAQQVAELNLRALRVARERSVALAPAASGRRAPHAIDSLHSAWRLVGDEALVRLAHSPYLLVDAHFAEAARWGEAVAIAEGRSLAGAPLAGDSAAAAFTDPQHAGFVATLFLYAWHLSRAEPITAELALGASAETLALIRTLSLRTIEQLARTRAGWVALRWEDRPAVWAAMLGAASRGDREALRIERLKGMQRIAGACAAADR